MFEGLLSGRVRVPPAPRRNPRTSSFAGPPSYNKDIKISGPIFQGSVKGYETQEYTQAPKVSNPHFTPGSYVRISHGPDNVSDMYKVLGRGEETEEGSPTYVLQGTGRNSREQFEALSRDLVPAHMVNPSTSSTSRRGGMRRNPESGSAALYETFHQRAPERVEEYEENFHYHGWLAELGEMQEIKVALIYLDPPKEAVIRFDPGTKLGCSEDGRQLYMVGGDQSVDLKGLGFGKEWTRDYMLLGVLHELTYRTKKGFDKFKTIDYYHELGEDSGDCPVLAYDNLNQQLMIVGGKYVVKYEGIVN
jgi:hypothetical protein